MSDNAPSKRPTGKIAIQAPAGLRYSINEASGRMGVSSVGSQTIELPRGLYEVTWRTRKPRKPEIVRLPGGEVPVTVAFKGDVAIEQSKAKRDSVRHLIGNKKALPPSQRDYGSSILVVVEGSDPDDELIGSIRLLNSKSIKMRADRDNAFGEEIAQGGLSRFYNVRPGDYLLNFPAMTGETLQQSVPALPGRTTLVIMQPIEGTVLLSGAEKFESVEGKGIEVRQTIIVSADQDDAEEILLERIRLARVLLTDLQNRTSSLDPGFIDLLNKPTTDPILRLYGAAVLISALEAMRPPFPHPMLGSQLSAEINVATPDPELERKRAWNLTYDWLNLDHGFQISTDETVLKWRLRQLALGSRKVRTRGQIENPPILALNWRWAIEHSQRHPKSLPPTRANVAAVRSQLVHGPWLSWRAAGAKATPAPEAEPDTDLNSLAQVVTVKSEKFVDLVSKAKPNFQTISANQIVSSMTDAGTNDSFIQMINGGMSPASSRIVQQSMLAMEEGSSVSEAIGSLGLPGDAVPRRMFQVSQELDALIQTYEHTAERTEVERDQTFPPAMYRPIHHPDDVNRGRFGGAVSSNGFSASVRFSRTKRAKVTRVDLTIAGPARDGSIAQVFLHDSFNRPERDVMFSEGKATLDFLVWGGFTIGIWIEDKAVELELNLATVRGAPVNVRDR